MKKQMVRLICMLLCLAVCLTGVPACAQEAEKSAEEEYRDRVLERYDQSFMGSSYYENLQKESGYLYEQWAMAMEDAPIYQDIFTSSADFLLDKQLDEEAYTAYLLKLMQMLEAGFGDTAASQAMYTARVNGGDVLKGGVTIVSKLLGAASFETAKKVSAAMDFAGAGLDANEVLGEGVSNSEQLAVVSVGAALYEEKMAVLNAIAEHAEDENLKKAAQSLIEPSILLFLSRVMEGLTLAGAEAAMTAADIDNYMALASQIYEDRLPALQKAAQQYMDTEKAEKLLGAVGQWLGMAVPVYNGFVIGSEFMKLAVGNEAECYREMQAMSAISEALSRGFQAANNAAAASDPDARYEAIKEYVALGEALVYSRLRGDYCYLLSTQIIELGDYVEEHSGSLDGLRISEALRLVDVSSRLEGAYDMNMLLDVAADVSDQDIHIERFRKIAEYYEYLEMNIETYYEVLSGIFPDHEPQVIVTAELAQKEGVDYYYAVYVPRVEVVGYEEATRKINEVLEPDARMVQACARAVEFARFAEENRKGLGSSIVPYNTYYLNEAICIGDALSLQMNTSAAGDGGTGSVSYLFDITSGSQLSVLDLLDAEKPDAKEKLVGILADELEEQVGWVFTTFTDVAESVVYGKPYQGSDLSDVFSVNADGLVMKFSSGIILPVMGGSPRVLVPYEKLQGILDSRFLPEDKVSMGKVRFHLPKENLPKPEVRREYGEESLEAVHIVGDIYDVGINETRYPQDWSFSYAERYGGIVFYANYLTNELVWVPENPGGDYTLSYDDKSEFYRAENE